MIINKPGESFLYEGTEYHIGDRIIGTGASEYAGLNGVLYEIRDGEDKQTENETPDFYCSFAPPVLPHDIKELEKRLSELYQSEKHLGDISLDCVIMAPNMIMPEGSKKQIKVYVVVEDWASEDSYGHSIYLKPSLLEAKALLNSLLQNEIYDGCISDWIKSPEYETESHELSYEGWLKGIYMESHYSIHIEKTEMGLDNSLIFNVGRYYIDGCSYEDFVSQVEGWEEVDKLSNTDYQKYIIDSRIPDMIEKHLSDCYWESYWNAVSETAHELLREYSDKNTVLCENTHTASGKEDKCQIEF